MSDAWKELVTRVTEYRTLQGVSGLLGWDQQTHMPPGGAALRGEQSALLARLAHEGLASPRTGELLAALEGQDLDEVQRAGVRNLRLTYDRATRVGPDLVERLARAEAEGFETWVRAKQASDFAAFAPVLERVLGLVKEQAAAIDPDRHPYDVLLEGFDPGVTVEGLKVTFARLREGLVELIDAVRDGPSAPEVDETFDLEGQRRLHDAVLPALGYDLGGGRLDAAAHPFTVGFGPGDVRITTRLYANDLLGGLGGTVHEAGHGMYEQGLPYHLRGSGVDEPASLGLHESQSRFWENFIGRSLPFFRWLEGPLRAEFPGSRATADALYRAANRVRPGLVRVTADEVTYNLHIIVRFELEVALFEGRLAVRDLPEAWNAAYERVLGVVPPDDARGVLQDVHWSGGAFAYFPSYTLGNLYAASLGAKIQEDLPGLWEGVQAGDFAPVLGWLREHVHAKGHLLEAPDLVRSVCGERDAVADLLDHVWARHGALAGVKRAGLPA